MGKIDLIESITTSNSTPGIIGTANFKYELLERLNRFYTLTIGISASTPVSGLVAQDHPANVLALSS